MYDERLILNVQRAYPEFWRDPYRLLHSRYGWHRVYEVK